MKRASGLPIVRIPADELPEGCDSGWVSPPGVTPRYRTLAAFNSLRKLPKSQGLRKLAMPGGDWHVVGSLHDGKRWVHVAVGGFRVVIGALRELIGSDLQVPTPARLRAQMSLCEPLTHLRRGAQSGLATLF